MTEEKIHPYSEKVRNRNENIRFFTSKALEAYLTTWLMTPARTDFKLWSQSVLPECFQIGKACAELIEKELKS